MRPPVAHGARQAAVVVNGHASGVGDCERLVREVQAVLPGAEVSVTGSLEALYEALEGRQRVVLVGGDGSLHAALNAPLAELPELALVPAGQANNVARALGIPTELKSALRLAASDRARPLDVLRVETSGRALLALEGVSAGLQAHARSRYRGDNSGHVLRGAAVLAGALVRFHPPDARIVIDGVQRHAGPLAQAFVSNLPYFGPGFRVSPHSDPRDGHLDVVAFQPRGPAAMLRELARVRRGAHLADAGVRTFRGREAAIEGSIPVVADAVPLGTGPVSVRIERGRLRVVAGGGRA